MAAADGDGPSQAPRIGTEIPWSVAWTSEHSFRLKQSADFDGKVELDQGESPGAGEPVFAAVHVTRQRRGMIHFLCHVCGRPTAPDDRYIFPVASGGFVTLHDGSVGYGCNVPPIHRECAGLARAQCPHLGRLADEPLSCGGEEGRLIPRTDIVPGMEEIAKALPPGVEVIFSCYRLYGPDFTRRIQDARGAWDEAVRARRAARS